MRKLFTLMLFSLGMFAAGAQSITVTQPNGGEVMYACQTYVIKWTSAGVSNYYDIDYSLNGGAVWASIASNINITNGQYSWTVPNVESNTCLIRVRDKNDPTKFDISDANFTIHIPITVTVPNGGESWVGNSSHLITWNIQGTSLTFNIDYSTNGGSTWTGIVTNLSTSVGTYNWTVPNIPSATCLVRVRDAVTTCMQDQSDNSFTITAAQPVLTYPNGGESFSWGQSVNITWTAATFFSTVRLEYSIDNGTTWTLVTANTANNGSYTWTIPSAVNSTQCLVKASNFSNVAINDISNATFSILQPKVTITSPNGGENWLGCDAHTVTATASNLPSAYSSSTFSFYYSIDNGSTWTPFGSVANPSSASLSYSWTLPNGVSTTQALVRVTNDTYSTFSDTSNAPFSIQPNNVITVTAPNGGEILPALSNTVITWTNTAGASGLYNVQYSVTSPTSGFITLASGISGNTYNWNNIPNNPGTTYYVRVQDAGNVCKNDVSNAAFTVTAAQPVLTYPNGGETLSWGQSVNITWSAATFFSTIRLEYSIDNGTTWTLITANTANSGSYTWTVPQLNSTQCLVKASNFSNVLINDISNATFSILQPKVVITSPNGGENWLGCDAHTVTATASNLPSAYSSSTFTFYYSIDNGATWTLIGSVANPSSASLSYSWTLPNGISTTQALVRVTNDTYSTFSDTSNAVFGIQPNNVITVTAPNGGEILPALSSTVITWTNTAGASGLYNVQFSAISPTLGFATLASGISGNTYTWNNIPNIPGTTYYVRVQDAGNTCKADISNAPFTVTAAQPILTYPNGGESFSWGQSINIIWAAATFYSNVRLEYSIDNGTTWTLITASTSNSGAYSWSVPAGINSTQCLVKASNVSNVGINDISNATFSILQPKVVITSPNGGENWLGCDAHTVTATAANLPSAYSSSTFSFYYSIDNGSTWTPFGSVANPSSASLSYSWTLPNGVSTTQALVHVTNDTYSTFSDTSNAPFSIQPNNVITVTAPNGGEVLPALSSTVITWTNTAGASGLYNVQFSAISPTLGFATLASGISGNTYTWNNIPNIPGTTYYVRVQDAGNTCKADASNAPFTVTAAQPILTYPNGGESFSWGQSINIIWAAATFYSNVRLEYSIDNGTTWTLITASTSNSGTYSWSVPAGINSTQCLVKASNVSNVGINDISNATFSILQPKVVITSPNGGENWLGCDAHTVTATAANLPSAYSSSTFTFYYSIDNGSTWTLIGSVANPSSASLSYSWTLPNGISTTQALVRVSNDSYATFSDTSNAVFGIQPNNVITVTAPNGGEILPALSSTVITWTNTAGASGLYNVQFSAISPTLGFATLASGISGNTYTWNNIPNIPGTTYYVRVQDAGNTCKADISNAPFTVTAAQPILTYPNGGESFSWGQSINIIWAAATFYSNVRLEYSIDNGTTWTLITASTSNSGAYSWSVPAGINSTQCLVKASNVSNVGINDISNATFSILQPKVVITSPNGGENWLGCDAHTVTATAANLPSAYSSSTFTFYYSIDNGSTWTLIGSVANPSSASLSYSWTLPNGISTTQALVRVSNDTYSTFSDTSNAPFSIQPNNVITVTAPNGGEVLPALSSTVITWTNTAGASGLYNVQYSATSPTSGFVTLASGISGNSYTWNNIPNNPGTTFYVRVQDAGNVCRNDASNAAFTVPAAQPVLTYPNGAEQLWSATAYNITWTAATFYSNVRLEYSLDNGVTWTLITASTSNTGTYSWTTPSLISTATTCLVKASNVSNVSSNDISNAVFTIKPIVKIFTPNGLDQLGACTQTSISFDHTPAYTTYSIDYSLNNGTTWTSLISSQTFSGTTGSYTWTIPNAPSTQALVRVYPGSSTSLGDVSDTTFNIKPSVSILQPNYGGILQIGTIYPIKWGSDGISNLYDIAYSTSGSTGPWTNIVIGYNTATNTYNWTVPNIPSNNCFIRVRDNAAACKEDISNLAFTISNTAPPITVLTPNTADSLYGCQSYNITWSESGAPLGSYTIDLSPDGGTTWSNIVTNYATTAGNYPWIVPNSIANQAIVRVASSSVSTVNDVSDLSFVIVPRKVKATPDTTVCSGAAITLHATGGTGSYVWSPSTYLSSTTIANPTATPTASVNYILSSSNGTCIMRDTASIVVQQTPVFNITADATNTCGGQTVTFKAHLTGGGSNPAFQWKRNSNNVGNNDSTFVINTLNNSDTISCVLTYTPTCFAPVTSNNIVMIVNPKPNLGNDTTVSVSCAGCTINLNSVINTTGYLYVSWNTSTPTAASPGIYRVIVSQLNGCTCPDSDTAFVNVTAFSGFTANTCLGGSAVLASNLTGSSYQWQMDTGAGFTNLANNGFYAGVNTTQLNLNNVQSSQYGYQYRCVVDGSNSNVYTIKIASYWTGDANTDWESPANWGCGVVPDRNTDVYIYSGKAHYPDIMCNRACRSIFAAPGTSLKLENNELLYLTGH